MKQKIEYDKPRTESLFVYWNNSNKYNCTIDDKTKPHAHLLLKCKCGAIIREDYNKEESTFQYVQNVESKQQKE